MGGPDAEKSEPPFPFLPGVLPEALQNSSDWSPRLVGGLVVSRLPPANCATCLPLAPRLPLMDSSACFSRYAYQQSLEQQWESSCRIAIIFSSRRPPCSCSQAVDSGGWRRHQPLISFFSSRF
jgi:hypothetical protein